MKKDLVVQSCCKCKMQRSFSEISKDTVRPMIAACPGCGSRAFEIISGPKDFFERLDAVMAELNADIKNDFHSCAECDDPEPWQTDPDAWKGED